MHSIPSTEGRAQFSDLLNQASHGDRIAIIRNGKAVAALVPIEDAEYMERMEDERDAKLALKRLREIESGAATTPWRKVKKDSGL